MHDEIIDSIRSIPPLLTSSSSPATREHRIQDLSMDKQERAKVNVAMMPKRKLHTKPLVSSAIRSSATSATAIAKDGASGSDAESDAEGQALINAMKEKQQRDVLRQELIQRKAISEAEILQWGFDHQEEDATKQNVRQSDPSTGKRSSRYMDALMKKADERKRARQELDESRMQRQVEREREEFKDKAVFVTPSYVAKMEIGGKVSSSMKYAEIVKPSFGSTKEDEELQLERDPNLKASPFVKPKDQDPSAKESDIPPTDATRNIPISLKAPISVLADHPNSLDKGMMQPDSDLIEAEEIECARRRYFERLHNLPKGVADLF